MWEQPQIAASGVVDKPGQRKTLRCSDQLEDKSQKGVGASQLACMLLVPKRGGQPVEMLSRPQRADARRTGALSPCRKRPLSSKRESAARGRDPEKRPRLFAIDYAQDTLLRPPDREIEAKEW